MATTTTTPVPLSIMYQFNPADGDYQVAPAEEPYNDEDDAMDVSSDDPYPHIAPPTVTIERGRPHDDGSTSPDMLVMSLQLASGTSTTTTTTTTPPRCDEPLPPRRRKLLPQFTASSFITPPPRVRRGSHGWLSEEIKNVLTSPPQPPPGVIRPSPKRSYECYYDTNIHSEGASIKRMRSFGWYSTVNFFAAVWKNGTTMASLNNRWYALVKTEYGAGEHVGLEVRQLALKSCEWDGDKIKTSTIHSKYIQVVDDDKKDGIKYIHHKPLYPTHKDTIIGLIDILPSTRSEWLELLRFYRIEWRDYVQRIERGQWATTFFRDGKDGVNSELNVCIRDSDDSRGEAWELNVPILDARYSSYL